MGSASRDQRVRAASERDRPAHGYARRQPEQNRKPACRARLGRRDIDTLPHDVRELEPRARTDHHPPPELEAAERAPGTRTTAARRGPNHLVDVLGPRRPERPGESECHAVERNAGAEAQLEPRRARDSSAASRRKPPRSARIRRGSLGRGVGRRRSTGHSVRELGVGVQDQGEGERRRFGEGATRACLQAPFARRAFERGREGQIPGVLRRRSRPGQRAARFRAGQPIGAPPLASTSRRNTQRGRPSGARVARVWAPPLPLEPKQGLRVRVRFQASASPPPR